MSNEANTAEKKIAGERTVKKRAGRNVVVSPVNVKPSGKNPASKELTAPIGLVWNEDTAQTQKKPGKTVKKPAERPMITGTGWPDRPPAPKVNKPGPIEYKPSTAKKQEADKKEMPSEATKTPVRKQKPAVKKEPVISTQAPAREPFSSEERLDALMNNIEGGQTGAGVQTPAQRPEAGGQGQRAAGRGRQPVNGRPPQGRQQAGQPNGRQRPAAARQNADNPMKQGSVLYSPIPQAEARTPISPMQKKPAHTQIWEGPIRQIPGYGDTGYGPKFVRTVVTTTTTTYEPVTEDVIRQITSQTSPVALTENVLNQPPAMPPLPEQQAAGTQYPRSGQQGPQNRIQAGRPGTGQPGARQAGRRQPGQALAGQGSRALGRPQANRQQPARPGQPPVRPGQQPVKQPAQAGHPGQKQSIIGAMEKKSSGNPAGGMNSQLAEIEKALGLTNDNANAGNDPLTEAIINNAGVNPGNINDPGMNNNPEAGSPVTNNPTGPAAAAKPIQAGSPAAAPDKESKKSMEYMMLFVEGVIFLIVLAICISIFSKIRKGNKSTDIVSDTSIEETQAESEPEDTGDAGTEDFDVAEAGSEDILEGDTDLTDSGSDEETSAAPSGSVDVDNDKFTLKCTNVTVKLDTDGNPAALIYFSFKNKTSEQKALADVFPISVTQNGEPCDTFAAMEEYPEEYYNKDMQISDGSEISCAYAVSLKDAVSPISLTVHDNYDTFADVGTTEIALQ